MAKGTCKEVMAKGTCKQVMTKGTCKEVMTKGTCKEVMANCKGTCNVMQQLCVQLHKGPP